jgi:DNA-binding CsgD family transcriptional regulator
VVLLRAVNGSDGERASVDREFPASAPGVDSLAQIMLALLEAPGDPEVWRGVLASLARALGSTGMALLFGEGGRSDATDIVAGVPRAVISATGGLHGWGRLEEISLPSVEAAVPATASAGRLLCARIDEGSGHGCRLVLYRAPGMPAFDTATRSAFSEILPHAARSLALAQHLQVLGCRDDWLVGATELLPFGHLAIAGDGRMLFANPLAREMLSAADGLHLQAGRVVAVNATDDAQLQSRLRELLDDDSLDERMSINVRRRSGRAAYVVHLETAAAPGTAFATPRPRVRMIVIDACRGATISSAVLSDIYRLTRTEREVARCVADGDSLQEVARRLGVTLATIRTHLRSIFAKTGTSRQAELVRLLIQSCSVRIDPPPLV